MRKGFTLIELLVVISIISVASSIVFASVQTARLRGQNAAIQQLLIQVRSQAGIIQLDAGNYDKVCGRPIQDAQISRLRFAVESISDEWLCGLSLSPAKTWAVAAKLKAKVDQDEYWCVDSTGASRLVVLGGSSRNKVKGGSCPAS